MDKLYLLYMTMSIAEFLYTPLWKTELQTLFPWLTTLLNVCYLFWLSSCLTALFNNVKKQISKAENSQ